MRQKKTERPAFVKRDSIVAGKEYAQLLGILKERFRKSQIKAAVKVNTVMLEYYWDMGRDISRLHAAAKWGSAFFDCLSLDLKKEFPGQTGFSSANLRYAKRWYDFYNQNNIILQRLVEEIGPQAGDEIRQRLVDEFEMPIDFGKVPWGQHIEIFTRSQSVEEALFYIDETIRHGWSRPELAAEIDNDLYGKRGKAITNFDEKLPAPFGGLAQDILKSPYDFGFIDKKITSEKQLEDELASNITRFLLELGQGFAYVGRQMELKMAGGQTFIPDMIFYHTRLKLYVVCELKVTPFIPEFAGKLNFYVSAVDELLKQPDDNPTIGLLICKSKDNTIVEWSFRGMNQPLGVAEYKLGIPQKAVGFLPSESELQRIIDTYSDPNDHDSESSDYNPIQNENELNEPDTIRYNPDTKEVQPDTIIISPDTKHLKTDTIARPDTKPIQNRYKTEEKEAILKALRLTPGLSMESLAQLLNITKSSVQRRLKALVKEGKIHHEGPTNGGKWILIN